MMITCLLLLLCMAATASGYGDSRGRTFVLGFIQNRMLVKDPIIRIYVTTDQTNGVVTFSVPLQNSDHPPDHQHFKYNRRTIVKEYNKQKGKPDLHMKGTDYQTTCILVESTVDVTVQAASVNNLTSDAYLALPIWALGMEYYVMSYLYKYRPEDKQRNHRHGPSEFAVIALEKDTRVTFDWPEEVQKDNDFMKIPDVVLNTHEAFQIQSETSDLSGTFVKADKPVAVFSGTEWTAVGAAIMGDHLVEQLLPTYTWGSEFLIPPLATRTSGDVGKVVASKDNTRVKITTIEGRHLKGFKLDAGEAATFGIPSHIPVHVVSNWGISLAQFSKSFLADNNRKSDPMMMLIPPIKLYTKLYTFSAIQTQRTSEIPTEDESFEDYLTLITPLGALNGIEFTGGYIDVSQSLEDWTAVTLNGSFRIVTVNFTGSTVYKIKHKNNIAFAAFLYGFKMQEAYGMTLGRRIGPLDHKCVQTRTYQGDLFDNDCDGNYDEEILNNIDDDNDGIIDEDLEWVPPETTSAGTVTTAKPTSTVSMTTESSQPSLTTESDSPGTSGGQGGDTGGSGNSGGGGGGGGNSGGSGTGGQGGGGGTNGGGTTGGETSTEGNVGTSLPDGEDTGDGGPGSPGQNVTSGEYMNSTDPTWTDAGTGTGSNGGSNNGGNGGNNNGGNGGGNNGGNGGNNSGGNGGGSDNGGSSNGGGAGENGGDGDSGGGSNNGPPTLEGTEPITVTVNGTKWEWDGENWVSEDGGVASAPPDGADVAVTVNGTKWLWNGSSWVALVNETTDASGVGGSNNGSSPNSNTDSESTTSTITDDANTTTTTAKHEVPKGIACNGSGCELVSNDSIIAWSDIRLRAEQNSSLGVLWEGTFWLLDGDTWYKSSLLTDLMRISDQTFCLLISAKLWCYTSPDWTFLLEVSGIPDAEIWQDSLAMLTDSGSWAWEEGSISTTSFFELARIFGILAKWNSIPEGKRLGVIWNSILWIFGKDSVTYFSRRIRNDGVTVQWQDNSWTWDGSGWNIDDNNLLELLNNTFSIYWNGLLWRWNGTDWEMIRIPGLHFNPANDGLVFSWNNKTWYIDSKEGPMELPNSHIPSGVDRGDGPVVGFNDTGSSWVLTPEGEWVLVSHQPPEHLFDPVLGASWKNRLWIYDDSEKHWLDSVPHRGPFLRFNTDRPYPGILSDGVFWQWNGTEWVIRFERDNHGKVRRKRELTSEFLLNAWWDEEAWTLSNSEWTQSETSLSETVDLESVSLLPVLVLSVDGDIWVYNSSDWGLERDAVKLPDDYVWENTSLGFIFGDEAWKLNNKTLMGEDKLADSLGGNVVDEDGVGVVKEGTLWILNDDTWSDGNFVTNNTPAIEGKTQLGVVANKTVWFLKEGGWEVDNNTMDIPADEMGDRPAVIVNDSLWILNGNNPTMHDFRYDSEDSISGKIADVNIVWEGELWSYWEEGWISTSLSESDYPERGAIIFGQVWSIRGSTLSRHEKTLVSSEIAESTWGSIWLYFQERCYEWTQDTFTSQDTCLNAQEKTEVADHLVVVLNETKWVFNLKNHWAILNISTKGEIGQNTNQIGLSIGGTVWIWNGTHWTKLPQQSGEVPDFIRSTDSVAVFRNGYYWTWKETDWVMESHTDDVIASNNFPLSINYKGRSWVWYGSHIVPSANYGDGQNTEYSQATQIGIGINGISWVCNKNKCRHKFSNLDDALGNLLDQSPVGVNENSTFWVWNGTAWVDSADFTGPPSRGESGGQEFFIYVDGNIFKWNGTSWVEVGDGAGEGSLPVGANKPPPGYTEGYDGGGTDTSTIGGNQGGGVDIPGVSVTVNGTKWEWDGENWVSEDGGVALAPPQGTNITVTVNGTKWVWSGSSWVAQTDNQVTASDLSTEGNSGTTIDSMLTSQPPGGTNTSASTKLTDATGILNTEPGETYLSTDNPVGMTDLQWNSTEGLSTDDTVSGGGLRSTPDSVDNTDKQTSPKPIKVDLTPKPPQEPDSAAATGDGKDSKVVIIVVVVLLILLLILLIIILCCWCHKRKKRKAAQQKVNPAVSTIAVPRPTSRYQDPPMEKQYSDGSFYDPTKLFCSAQWSSSSSSLGQTAPPSARRYSSGRRSPRVSQAPPVDLPDLIISLPPGKHIHLKSPRLSPDPNPSPRQSPPASAQGWSPETRSSNLLQPP